MILIERPYADGSVKTDVALVTVGFAGKDFKKCRFSGAIGTDNAVAVARIEGGADVFEENLGAEAFTELIEAKQVKWLLMIEGMG
jgi:hypothetical protein